VYERIISNNIVELSIIKLEEQKQNITTLSGGCLELKFFLFIRGVNEPSLGEPRLSRLGSFIFGPSSSSSSSRDFAARAGSTSFESCSSLSRALSSSSIPQKTSKYKQENRTKSRKKRRLGGAPVGA
jgi:hypothetical protein